MPMMISWSLGWSNPPLQLVSQPLFVRLFYLRYLFLLRQAVLRPVATKH